MKKMRKIFAVLLTLVMVLAMSIPTFAAGATATITLSGDTLTKDTTIKYVQIVEPDTTGSTLGWKFSNDTIKNAFITAFNVNTADEVIQQLIIPTPDTNAATGTINASSKLGAALESLKNLATKEDHISKTTDGVPSAITDLDKAGLYLVTANATNYRYLPMLAYIKDEGLGKLVDASLTVKGSKDKVTKVIDGDESQSVSEGDKIGYIVTAEYPYYSTDAEQKTFTATDTLTNAKFEDNSLVITVDGITKNLEAGKDKDYSVEFDNEKKTMNIAFNYNAAYAGKTVTIKYTAVVGAGEGNVVNNIKSNFDTNGDSVTSAKVNFKVIKEGKEGKENKKLPGAEFTLYEYSEVEKERYTKVENASVIAAGNEDTSGTKDIWVKQVGAAQVTNNDGETTFVGLDAQKTYCVQETNAPTGYKIQKDYHVLTGADSTTVEGSKVYTFNNFDDVTVTDENLSALPSTGGIGTTIFTIAGCLIMVTAAGLFFASRKRTNK